MRFRLAIRPNYCGWYLQSDVINYSVWRQRGLLSIPSLIQLGYEFEFKPRFKIETQMWQSRFYLIQTNTLGWWEAQVHWIECTVEVIKKRHNNFMQLIPCDSWFNETWVFALRLDAADRNACLLQSRLRAAAHCCNWTEASLHCPSCSLPLIPLHRCLGSWKEFYCKQSEFWSPHDTVTSWVTTWRSGSACFEHVRARGPVGHCWALRCS